MRIVAGKYRRRKLLVNPGQTTRPITDRAKEYLFEHLRHHLDGSRVLDLFSGTGSMGLEALSRGAVSAVLVERDHRAFTLLKQNVDTLGVDASTVCWRTDALRSSFRPKGAEAFFPYNLVFCDPPYRMIPHLTEHSDLYRALQRLSRSTTTTPDVTLVLRTPSRAAFECPDTWTRCQTLTVSKMEMHIFQKDPAVATPE